MCIFVGVVAILGNCIAIAAFLKRRSLLTKHSISLFSLAIADTLNGLSFISLAVQFGTPINFYLIDRTGDDVINVCGVLINAIQMFPAYCSAIHTLLIAFERHLALVYPIKYHTDFTRTKAVYAAISVWVFAILANLAPAIAIVISFTLCRSSTVLKIREINPIYQGVLGLLVYVVVLVTLTVMLLRICRQLTTRRKQFVVTASNQAFDKILKICVIILVYFTVSYAPFIICNILGMFNTNIVAYKGMFYSSLLAATNSCINVFLYVLMSRKFQLTVKAMLSCQQVINSTIDQGSTGQPSSVDETQKHFITETWRTREHCENSVC